MIKLALIGDCNPEVTAHRAIPKALALAGGNNVQPEWLATDSAQRAPLDEYSGFWCVPASPYRSMEAALRVIRFARENNRPFLGTCGGCQHAVLEFARNVLHIANAGHKESDPTTAEPVITNLACSLIEANETLQVVNGTRLHAIIAQTRSAKRTIAATASIPTTSCNWRRAVYASAFLVPTASLARSNCPRIHSSLAHCFSPSAPRSAGNVIH
jgi:CTP synthase (UTP-ammonia lyase)